MAQSARSKELKSTEYELFILLLSLLSIINLVLELIPGINAEVKRVLQTIDLFLSIFFMGDFLYRFFTAESKTRYFFKNWGWADLLASLPLPRVRIFRVFRIVRVFRLLRWFGIRHLLHEIRNNRAGSALYLTVFLVIVVLESAGILILYAEAHNPQANITTASDAIWWGYVTITTVGYGDKYPVTKTGRLIGMMLLTAGVGLFGVLTGFLANAFLAPQEQEEPSDSLDPNDPKAKLAQVKQLLAAQEKANAELKARLEEIETLL